MTPAKSLDLELWRAWKQMPTPQNLEALIKQLNPVLQREIMRWSGIVPKYILENEAKKLAIKACHSYNPNAGTALATHVTNQLQKLSRIAYARQSTLAVPEQQRLTFNRYNAAIRHLEDMNGRKPALSDVADYLAIKPRALQRIVENVNRQELIESGEGPQFIQHAERDIISLAYGDMTPLQRRIFERRTGYNNTPIANNAQEILRELKITQSQLSYQLTAIKTLLERAQQLR